MLALGEPLRNPLFEQEQQLPQLNGHTADKQEEAARHGPASAPKMKLQLNAKCSRPVVISCECTVAHLTWDYPAYVNPPSDTITTPRLVVSEFQLFWAEVSTRPGGAQQILEDTWKPLPSGDVGVPEVQVGGLRPGKAYAVRVEATLDTSHVDHSLWDIDVLPSPSCIFTTPPTKPSAVKPPLLLSKERKSLKVKWNVPEEPGSDHLPLTYQLFMAPPPVGWMAPPNPQGFVDVYMGPERTYKASKLLPGTRYSFWVLARNQVGCSEPGQVSTYTTQATVPSQPEPPRPVSCTQNSITLQWVPPPGNGAPVSNYVLERDEGAPLATHHAGAARNTFTMVYAGPLQTVMVGGLRSGLHYRFRLRAENSEGQSFWSDPLLATPAPSAPGAPGALITSNITRNSATLSWGLPADDGGAPVGGHQVELQAISKAAAESMGSDWLKIFEGCISACTISSLQPGCSYRVRVRCGSSAGWGTWSLPHELTTAPDVPGAPGAPAIQQGGSTSLNLTWQPPRHNGGQRITAFLLEMLAPSASMYAGPVLPRTISTARSLPTTPTNNPAILVYRGEEPSATVSGLQPGVTYQFRVQACNPLGTGPWGDWSLLGTSADVPSAPMPPSLSAPPTSNSFKVDWQAPDCRGSPITGYLLQAAVQGQISSAGHLIPHIDSTASLHTLAQEEADEPATQQPINNDILKLVTSPMKGLQRGMSGPLRTGPKSGPWQQVYQGDALSADVSALQPCTRYLLRVSAVNQVGQGQWSPITALTTAPAAPTCPTQLTAHAAGPDTVVVRWQPPAADNGAAVQSYVVEVAGTSTGKALQGASGASSWQQVANVASDEHEVVVTGLLPGRCYLFRARCSNSCGSSPSCTSVSVTTDPAPPGSPPKPIVQQRQATQVRVKWDEPTEANGAMVTTYRLELGSWPESSHGSDQVSSTPLEDTGEASRAASASVLHSNQPEQLQGCGQLVWTVAYTGDELQARVVDLLPGCRYVVRVCAANSAGWGSYSSQETFMTALAPPGPPESLEACLAPATEALVDSGTHALQLRWLPPLSHPTQASVASYELHAVPITNAASGGTTAKEERRVVGKATEFVWSELQPGARYTIRVRAAGAEGAGHGLWSEHIEFVMPGHSRGVTDSADSMSAASGTNDASSITPPLSAATLKAHNERGGARRNAKRRSRQQANGSKTPNGVAASVVNQQRSTPALSHVSADEDAASITGGMVAANGTNTARSAPSASAPVVRNRINTTKLTGAAVQKRPKAPLQLGRELKQLCTPAGARKAMKSASRTCSRVLRKYVLQICIALAVALLAMLVRWALQKASGSYAISR